MDDPEILFHSLLHGTVSARRAFADALGETGDPRAPALLCQALGERQARAAAAQALVRIGSPAVPAVCQALRSEGPAARAAAAGILGQIGDASAVPALCDALRDGEASVRAQAIEALAQLGAPEAVPNLIEMLRYPRSATIEAAAAALARMGDRRAILPLWEALLDEPAELDSSLSQALGEIARREPGPELREVLQRLRREVRNLDGESRPTLVAVRRQLEAAAAPFNNMPIPAAAPAPTLASLPLPAAPAAPALEHLPLPAAAPRSVRRAPEPHPDGSSPAHRKIAGVQTSGCLSGASRKAQPPRKQAGVGPPAVPPPSAGDTALPSCAPPAAAADEILRRFQSVEPAAARNWTGLEPARVESDIVFRQRKGFAYAGATRRLAGPAFIWFACVASWCGALPSPQSWWFLAALLLPLPLAWVKLSSEVARLYFKVDPTTREVVVYRRWRPGDTKRKRLPFDRIDYFLGREWSRDHDASGRLYAALRDGSLEALTVDLGPAGHIKVNLRILAVTCARPAYFLDRHTQAEDLLAVRPEGGFMVRDRAKLWERAKLLYTPDKETPA